jgi:hypothetical protein
MIVNDPIEEHFHKQKKETNFQFFLINNEIQKRYSLKSLFLEMLRIIKIFRESRKEENVLKYRENLK